MTQKDNLKVPYHRLEIPDSQTGITEGQEAVSITEYPAQSLNEPATSQPAQQNDNREPEASTPPNPTPQEN